MILQVSTPTLILSPQTPLLESCVLALSGKYVQTTLQTTKNHTYFHIWNSHHQQATGLFQTMSYD